MVVKWCGGEVYVAGKWGEIFCDDVERFGSARCKDQFIRIATKEGRNMFSRLFVTRGSKKGKGVRTPSRIGVEF